VPQIDPFLLQIAERKRAEAGNTVVADPQNVLEWAQRYRRLEGRKFSLDLFKPLVEIYLDEHPHKVVKKPAQRGVSEYAVSLACFALELGAKQWTKDETGKPQKNGLNVGYLFPVKQDLEDFAKERVNELREESTHLALLFSDEEFDSLSYKKVGSSHLYMRGAYAKTGLLSFPADVLIYDEFDQMDSKAVALVSRRMNASLVRRDIKISTPTFPGRGISKAYAESDQRIWQTPCPHCQGWVSFDFYRDVWVDGQPYDAWQHWPQERVSAAPVTLHCPECHGVIDDEQRCADGRWYVQRPDITRVHGYHVPWWAFPMADLSDFAYRAVSDDPAEIEELNRSDLGLEYGVGGGSVTEGMLQQLSAEYPTDIAKVKWRNTTLGCDIGAKLHYRIDSEDQYGNICVREMGSVDDWLDLDQLMFRYKVRLAVVDAQPEWHESMNFCAKWKGRAKRGFEQVKTSTLKGILFNEKKGTNDVQINRRLAMDLVLANIGTGKELWPSSIVNDPEVIAHMIAPTRISITDETGQQDHDWVHSQPDHLFHASVFCTIARKMLPAATTAAPAVGGDARQGADTNRMTPPAMLIQKYASERPLFRR
jgi:hypothetical protein